MNTVPKPVSISRGFMGFAAAIAALGMVNPASAAQFGNLRYEVKHGSTITITGTVHDPVGALVIPAKIEGKPVKKIADYAFHYCREITEVTIPEGVTQIGVGGFSECQNLRKVSLPDSLEKIGTHAFFHADLRHVKIPARLEVISNWAFSANSRLHDVEIPEGVRVIGTDAFGSSWWLESISLPASVVDVKTESFAGADLKHIDVAPGNRLYCSVDGVLYDKNRTLLIYCPARKSGPLEIPAGVKRLVAKSLFRCRDLKKVILPDSLIAIETRALSECGLTEINFPNGLKRIGYCALARNGLGDITIPASVERIGSYAFASNYSIKNAYFNGDAPSDMGKHVFDSTYFSGKPYDHFKICFYEGSTGFTEPTWMGCNTVSLSRETPVTNMLLFGAGWRK